MKRLLIGALALVFLVPAARGADDKPLPDLKTFLPEIRKKLRPDRALLSQYTYTSTVTERHLEKDGRVRKTEVEVREVFPLPEGGSFTRLTSRDGQPLPPKELAKQKRREQKLDAERARKLSAEMPENRKRRLAQEAEKKRAEDDRAMDEAFQLFDIRMVGREAIEGVSVIRLDVQPKPGFQPQTDEGKVLSKMGGIVWVSEDDQQVVRMEMVLLEDYKFGFGVLARLHKGAAMKFQRRKINSEVWLPAVAHFAGSARLLLFKGMRLDVTNEFSNYKKFSVATSIQFK
ncbi:MAG: hypothetical protein ACR2L2_02420 [Acidobacteriota bacterium]